PPQIYAYRVTSSIEASTTDLQIIGDIMARAIDAGANNISSLSFGLSDQAKKQAKIDALSLATQDASQKAEAIADSLNLKLGKIYYINERGISYPGPVYAEDASLAAGEVPEGRGVAPPPVSPGELEASAEVEIVFNFN
ncbi:MAG: SIMPL domain-containing protein, partial [Actinomycetota bacterium]